MARIIIVEDEQNIADLLKMNLEMDGHQIQTFSRGDDAYEAMSEWQNADLLIVDIMLPGVNGLDITKALRENSNMPILILSAKGETSERIEGLKSGANDYLPKPFDLEELLLRVENLLPDVEENYLIIGDKKVDLNSFECMGSDGNVVHEFGKREIGLLSLFDEKSGQVVSRDEILSRLWTKEDFPSSRTIDNYILIFRKIFETNPREPRFFHSVRGVGYKYTP